MLNVVTFILGRSLNARTHPSHLREFLLNTIRSTNTVILIMKAEPLSTNELFPSITTCASFFTIQIKL